MAYHFVDIHCHILPGIDDGPDNWDESLAMARLSVADGMRTIVATPHQLGAFDENVGNCILPLVDELQQRLDAAEIPLRVLPGGELRIEPAILTSLKKRTALTLGNHVRHVLIELPHDRYFPIDSLMKGLARQEITAILAHPERNGGILQTPSIVRELVDAGCLMQVTASSLTGSFGKHCRKLAEQLIADNLVHFIATDGHGTLRRQPLMHEAFRRVAELAGEQMAVRLCCHNPNLVATNHPIPSGSPKVVPKPRSWFARRAAG